MKRLVPKLERSAPGLERMGYEAGRCGDALQVQVATARVSTSPNAIALSFGCPANRVFALEHAAFLPT